ncbi:SPFH/Band 7/PHB domain protein, partial [Streptomyces sp. NPDC086077]
SALREVSRAFGETLPQSSATRKKAAGDTSADDAADDAARAAEAAAEAVADAARADAVLSDVHPPPHHR